jgi:hypothetical protein
MTSAMLKMCANLSEESSSISLQTSLTNPQSISLKIDLLNAQVRPFSQVDLPLYFIKQVKP